MPKKRLEFGLSMRDSIVAFNFSLVLLPAKIDHIAEEQCYKEDAFRPYYCSYFKMILALSAKIIILYMQMIIIEVKISTFK